MTYLPRGLTHPGPKTRSDPSGWREQRDVHVSNGCGVVMPEDLHPLSLSAEGTEVNVTAWPG